MLMDWWKKEIKHEFMNQIDDIKPDIVDKVEAKPNEIVKKHNMIFTEG